MENPVYIPIKEISLLPVVHTWNDWDPFEPLAWPDETLKNKLKDVSNTGISCFALGCAEWVVYRFEKQLKSNFSYHFLEAFWLYIIGVDAALPAETESEQWEGVVLGPINLSLMTVLNTIYLAEQGPPVQNGALAAVIVEYVLQKNKKFENWKDNVINRLLKYSPRNKEFPDGKPLPRELLDPDVDYKEELRMNLIKKMVYSIDFTLNPFLKKIDKRKLQLRASFEEK